MKKSFLLSFVLCCFLTESIQAQHTYVPMESITDRLVATSGFLGTTYSWISYAGDTMIGGQEYAIHQQEIAPGIYGETYLREDVANQKVYRYRGEPDYFEYLYYDFSLTLNGVLPIYANGIWYDYFVTSLDTLDSPAGPLRRWIFDGPIGPGFFYIEAVGGSPLVYEFTTLISDPVYATVCAYNVCEKVFGNDNCSPPPKYVTSEDLTVSICEGESFLGHESSGTYMDTLTSVGGCDSIINSELSVLTLPELSETYELCPGEEIYGIDSEGLYIINLPSPNGCDTLLSVSVSILDSTDVLCLTSANDQIQFDFQIFPNPAQDWLNIKVDKSAAVSLFDLQGRQVYNREKLAQGLHNINMTNLPKGIYFLQLQIENEIAIRKIIKQ